MPDRYDAVVIGAGPGGEHALGRLHDQGLRVALCERELAHVDERPDHAVLDVPAADRKRRGAERLQGSLGRQLEYVLEPVRAGRDSGDVDQGAQLRLGEIPVLHGLSGDFSSS